MRDPKYVSMEKCEKNPLIISVTPSYLDRRCRMYVFVQFGFTMQ